MLVLSRKIGQGLRIGADIRVVVVAIDGQFARIGIEAPAGCKILREELWRSVAEDNQAATAAAAAGAFAQVFRAQIPRSAGPPKGAGKE
ncbi:MAG: carbon storage regulator [Chloroflexota bacterium]